jgi:HSP20 family protein
MAVTDKLKGMVEELRNDLNEVKDQVKQLLPRSKDGSDLPVRQQNAEHPIMALQRETNRLFDDFRRGSWSPFSTDFALLGDLATGTGWPRIDIAESAQEVRVSADLAGLDRGDVDVSVADGVLTIRGETKHEDDDVGRHHFRRERFYGAFSRSVQVPANVDLDRIKAKMKKGVLEVTMPKLGDRKTRGRRIPIGQDEP